MLNERTYEVVEFTTRDDEVIGRVWRDEGKLMYAEIIENYIVDTNDLIHVQDFIDEVKAIMNPMVNK